MQVMNAYAEDLLTPAHTPAPRRNGERATQLLVVGHARSGTTILLNALNTADDVYMLGEPFSYRDPGEPDFRRRFNAMHRGYNNQIAKSTYAPTLPGLPEDADHATYFTRLSEYYPVFGEKISLSTPRYGSDFAKLKSWIEARRPQDTLSSMMEMFPHILPRESVFSYALTVRLYLDLARTLPNVRHVMHESVCAESFEDWSGWLGVDLGGGFDCYTPDRAARRPPAPPDGEIETLVRAYDFLAKWTPGLIAPALLQTEEKLSGRGGSELGRLYARLDALLQDLAKALGRETGDATPFDASLLG